MITAVRGYGLDAAYPCLKHVTQQQMLPVLVNFINAFETSMKPDQFDNEETTRSCQTMTRFYFLEAYREAKRLVEIAGKDKLEGYDRPLIS